MKNKKRILITAMSAICALRAYAADDLDINSNGANITGSINNINFIENGAVGTVELLFQANITKFKNKMKVDEAPF